MVVNIPEFTGKESESRSVKSDSLRPHGLFSPWNSPGHNASVGSLSLLQQTFLTQALNWGLLRCRWILYQLSYEGSPSLSLGESQIHRRDEGEGLRVPGQFLWFCGHH